MVAFGPITWNATALDVQGDAVTLDVRSKWVNYHNGGGLWLPIESTWSEGSNGEYEHTASNWTLIAPATASGRIATYQENDWDIFGGGAITLTRTPALELEHVNASGLVDAYYDPAKPYEVRYPDAFGAGCSLVLRTWHARAMRPEHIIEITQLPANGANVEIVERVYTTLRIPGWDGSEVDIGATGAGLYVPSDTVGMGMRPAVAWWRGSDGVLQTRSISVIAKRETGYVTLRKIIPYAAIVEAFAAGAIAMYADETLTVNPDPNVETTSWDGYLQATGTNQTWSALSNAANAGSWFDASSTIQACGYSSGNTSNRWAMIVRGAYGFDTSALGSGATVTAAELTLYGSSKSTTFASGPPTVVGKFTASSSTGASASDYGSTDKVLHSDTNISYSSWSTTGGNVYTLNATGVAGVNKTGVTWLMSFSQFDQSAGAPAWSVNKTALVECYGAEQTGTSSDPKLVVTYTAGGGGGSSGAGNLLLLGVGA